MYHDLLKMPQHEWEQIREGASQALGHRPSAMWGPMHIAAPERGGKRTLMDIARTATPADAARAVEVEGAQGGDFTHAVRFVAGSLRRVR